MDGDRIDTRDFRRALGSFGTGVTVITARGEDGQRVALTANSFSSVSLDPPLVLWSLGIYAPSLPVFQDASHFAVNVLSVEQEDLAVHFSKPSDDKFRDIACGEGLGRAPILDDVIATFECRNAFRYYGGDHVIFLGAVERYGYRQDGEPLLFCRGAFGRFETGE